MSILTLLNRNIRDQDKDTTVGDYIRQHRLTLLHGCGPIAGVKVGHLRAVLVWLEKQLTGLFLREYIPGDFDINIDSGLVTGLRRLISQMGPAKMEEFLDLLKLLASRSRGSFNEHSAKYSLIIFLEYSAEAERFQAVLDGLQVREFMESNEIGMRHFNHFYRILEDESKE